MAGEKAYNNLLLSPLRGWDSLLAASLCYGCPKARRYAISRGEV